MMSIDEELGPCRALLPYGYDVGGIPCDLPDFLERLLVERRSKEEMPDGTDRLEDAAELEEAVDVALGERMLRGSGGIGGLGEGRGGT